MRKALKSFFAASILWVGLIFAAPVFAIDVNIDEKTADKALAAFDVHPGYFVALSVVVGLSVVGGMYVWRTTGTKRIEVQEAAKPTPEDELISRKDFEGMKKDNKEKNEALGELIKELRGEMSEMKDEQNGMEKRLTAQIHKLALAMAKHGIKINEEKAS